MRQTIIVTTIAESLRNTYPGVVCRVSHEDSVVAVQAVKSAASDYVTTAEGLAYQASISDDFNWGDALTEIPERILKKHGILEIEILQADAGMVVVNHDEHLA